MSLKNICVINWMFTYTLAHACSPFQRTTKRSPSVWNLRPKLQQQCIMFVRWHCIIVHGFYLIPAEPALQRLEEPPSIMHCDIGTGTSKSLRLLLNSCQSYCWLQLPTLAQLLGRLCACPCWMLVAVDLQLLVDVCSWQCFCNLHRLFFHCSLAACLTSKMVSVADHALPPAISLYCAAALPCICGCFCYDSCDIMAMSQRLTQKLHEHLKIFAQYTVCACSLQGVR